MPQFSVKLVYGTRMKIILAGRLESPSETLSLLCRKLHNYTFVAKYVVRVKKLTVLQY